MGRVGEMGPDVPEPSANVGRREGRTGLGALLAGLAPVGGKWGGEAECGGVRRSRAMSIGLLPAGHEAAASSMQLVQVAIP